MREGGERRVVFESNQRVGAVVEPLCGFWNPGWTTCHALLHGTLAYYTGQANDGAGWCRTSFWMERCDSNAFASGSRTCCGSGYHVAAALCRWHFSLQLHACFLGLGADPAARATPGVSSVSASSKSY